MASAAQLAANRSNAQKSTAPGEDSAELDALVALAAAGSSEPRSEGAVAPAEPASRRYEPKENLALRL